MSEDLSDIPEAEVVDEPVPKKIAAKRPRKNTGRPIENPAWEHYTFDPDTGKTQCKHCPMSLKGKHTTNLVRHLLRHPKEYAQFSIKDAMRDKKPKPLTLTSEPFTAKNVNVSLKRKSECIMIEIVTPEKKNKQKKKTVLNNGALTVTEVAAAPQLVTDASTSATNGSEVAAGTANQDQPVDVVSDRNKRQKRFREILVELVSTTSVPAQLLENEVFRKMINFLDPDISCPSRETLGREVIRTNAEIKKEMRELLHECDRITIGANICTKKTVTCGYLGVIAYFYHRQKQRRYSLALGLKELSNPQSQQEVNSVLAKVLQEYGIEHKKIFRTIVGNGGKIDSDGAVIADEAQEASYYLNIHFCDTSSQSHACGESCVASSIQVNINEPQVRRLSCFVHQLQSAWKPHERKSHFDDTVCV